MTARDVAPNTAGNHLDAADASNKAPHRPQARKPRPVQREVQLELCGRNDDSTYMTCFHLLRKFRNRYQPLIRPFFTVVSCCDDDADNVQNHDPTTSTSSGPTDQHEALTLTHHFTKPMHAFSVDGEVVIDRLHGVGGARGGGGGGERTFAHYLDHRFLAYKLFRSYVQQQPQSSSSSLHQSSTTVAPAHAKLPALQQWPLYLRHYVHESSRVATLLIADATSKRAVVIDPLLDIAPYVTDLRHHGLALVAVCLTHAFMDVCTGHKELLEVYPDAELVCCSSVWNREGPGSSSSSQTSSLLQDTSAPVSANEEYCSMIGKQHIPPPQRQIGSILWERNLSERTTAQATRKGGLLTTSSTLGRNEEDAKAAMTHDAASEAPSTNPTVPHYLPVTIRARWTPAATDDSLTFEVMVGSVRVAVATGISLPLDGLPRHDLRKAMQQGVVDEEVSPEEGSSITAKQHLPIMQPSDVIAQIVAECCCRSSPTSSSGASAAVVAADITPGIASTAPLPSLIAKANRDVELFPLLLTLQWMIREYGGGGGHPTTSTAATSSWSQPAPQHDAVIVFPSHGGYNHLTHQLDLHWAAHVGDLKRFAHVRKVWEMIMTWKTPVALMQEHVSGQVGSSGGGGAQTSAKNNDKPPASITHYIKSLPKLPIGHWYRSNRRRNMVMLSSSRLVNTTTLPGRETDALDLGIIESKVATAAATIKSSFVIDVRPYEAYIVAHIRGSVNIPMTYPADAYGAKKAELWLQCTVNPDTLLHQQKKMVVICSTVDHKAATRSRMLFIGIPSNVLEVLCPHEVPDWDLVTVKTGVLQQTATPASYDKGKGNEVVGGESSNGQEHSDKDDPPSWDRLISTASLEALSITVASTTLVVDVRTPYEFKNGSHRSSVHCALADLCSLYSNPSIPMEKLALKMLTTLHDDAIVGGTNNVTRRLSDLRSIVVYCAAGYRSHIAVSMIRSALEQADPSCMSSSSSAAVAADALLPPVLSVVDVAGGSLAIMMHRPDVWLVKDRSIICIS